MEADSEQVRLRAAERVLDQCGLIVPTKIEANISSVEADLDREIDDFLTQTEPSWQPADDV